jgi:hypothetical protein
MKMLSIALATLPLMAVAAALAQTPVVPEDEDLLTPHERNLSRNPHLYPEWTWMTKPQAIVLLKTIGFSGILRIEKDGALWRAVAIKDHASYHVVINRYTGLVAHMDKTSREQYPVVSKMLPNGPIKAAISPVMKPGKILPALNGPIAATISTVMRPRKMLPTLNGPIEATISPVLKPGKPVASMMGEVAWTWMKASHAKLILKSKGYANIVGLKRDAKGIWRAKALRRDFALNVAIDNYGNVEAQTESQGGLAQGSLSY